MTLNVVSKLRSKAVGIMGLVEDFLFEVPLNAALPTCDVNKRGGYGVLKGGAGVADSAQICLKNSADAYAYVTPVAGSYQPLDSDLTTIAGLTPTTDNVIQSKSGAWASRTIAQLITDLIAGGMVSVPLGGTVPYVGATAPSASWLIADGTAISRTTYAALYAIQGNAYGAGDGTTTFNLPDLRGRVPVGFKSGEAEWDTLGETGGARTVTLTAAESGLPAHLHAAGTYTYTNTTLNAVGNQGTGGSFARGVTSPSATVTGNSGTVAAAAASSAHTNEQPFQAVNYIIRVL